MDNFQVYLNHMESLSHQMNDGLSFLLVLRSRWNSLQPRHTCRCRICPNCSERKQGFHIWNI